MSERPIAVEGENCWRLAPADRVAFLVDADAYYSALKVAIKRARRSIIVIGWDVHSRTPLGFKGAGDAPHHLGNLLDRVAASPDGPTVRVLDWDSPLFYAVDRQWVPALAFDWFTCDRVRFALDDAHPIGASQHQKIVVVDDALAFVGGIDLTYNRLDDQRHEPGDPRRRNPDGTHYEAQHDVQVALDGAAAQALGDMARERWLRATGERLKRNAGAADCWPPDLAPDLEQVDVAVLRTLPAWKDFAPVREIERHTHDLIAAARHSIYLENQYLTADSVVAALSERLQAADGPEVVMVLPPRSHGWLERVSMDLRQGEALRRLREADKHGRLLALAPMGGDDQDYPIHVHAKLMLVDQRVVRVGSANLNNRSMGLDSECDVAIEAAEGSAHATAIAQFGHRLLAEHLACAPDEVARAIDRHGTLTAAIAALQRPGRSLVPLPELAPSEALVDPALLDPAEPAEVERVADDLVRQPDERRSLRGAFGRLALVVGLLLLLAALWRWGPLAALADPVALYDEVARLRGDWTLTAVMLAAFVVGGLVMFPVTVLILACGLLYGPVTGAAVAMGGALLGASAGYGCGVLLGRHGLRRLLRGRVERISQHIAHRGVLSMSLIRMLPVAPFTLVNLVAGASHLRFRDFLVGSAIGMAPGIVAIAMLSGQVGAVLRDPSPGSIAVLVGVVVVITVAATWAWRRLADWRHARAD